MQYKGQLISKGHIGLFKSTNYIFVWVFALASKQIKALYSFDLTFFQRLGQKCWKKFRRFIGKKEILKLTDLQTVVQSMLADFGFHKQEYHKQQPKSKLVFIGLQSFYLQYSKLEGNFNNFRKILSSEIRYIHLKTFIFFVLVLTQKS